MLKAHQDAYGRAMWDFFNQKGGFEVIEREDGWIGYTAGPPMYFAEHKNWPSCQRRALRFVRGRVLDVGCGAGRHALYLQDKGLAVWGVDLSPLAIRTARARGLKRARVASITELNSRWGTFDTLLMLGNNFGLFANVKRARWLLRRFRRMTSPRARIIAESRDPYETEDPDHLAYHRFNRRRGRLPGQIRLRVRYKKFITPWFDYLMVSLEEMREILAGTGWEIVRCFPGESGNYVVVIEKEPHSA